MIQQFCDQPSVSIRVAAIPESHECFTKAEYLWAAIIWLIVTLRGRLPFAPDVPRVITGRQPCPALQCGT